MADAAKGRAAEATAREDDGKKMGRSWEDGGFKWFYNGSKHGDHGGYVRTKHREVCL